MLMPSIFGENYTLNCKIEDVVEIQKDEPIQIDSDAHPLTDIEICNLFGARRQVVHGCRHTYWRLFLLSG